jgi:hypothetical protein
MEELLVEQLRAVGFRTVCNRVDIDLLGKNRVIVYDSHESYQIRTRDLIAAIRLTAGDPELFWACVKNVDLNKQQVLH